ncbi:copper resistance protein NlpE N-terminal domain-containing protein [Membranihabitans maritimus]|uniref:copper resistance protein NlpE N-terminal domain-containing protein n=1 Tax=Membranihabitans maritimus TaxID=2904244 RepID=UPI001F4463F7|nr:copper resistance protein NlpE N-terminal domain-containing protein [Membranihabitans maritimus]
MKFQQVILLLIVQCIFLFAFQSCKSDSSDSKEKMTLKFEDSNDFTLYKGSISRVGLDSIYNKLYLYKDETFKLEQVQRLGEHHLNEKTTNGLYSFLKDGSQMGLFLSSGTIILRFAVKDEGLYLMDMEGNNIQDADRVWKIYHEKH